MSDRESRLTRSSLIYKVRRGSGSAWTQLVDVFQGLVLAQIGRANIQPADAADISQEVLEAVLVNIEKYVHDRDRPGSFRAWLAGITRNKISDYRRHRQHDPKTGFPLVEAVQDAVDDLGAEDDVEFVESIQPIAKIIENVRRDFSTQTWQIFWRAVVHDEPLVNIADDLGIAAETARQAKYRVASRLRDELDAYYYPGL